MRKFLRTWAFRLWPPYEAQFAGKHIDSAIAAAPDSREKTIREEIAEAITRVTDLASAESSARLVIESEEKRNETIEAKAGSLVFALGVAVSLVSVAPALFGGNLHLPFGLSLIARLSSLSAVVHFLLAAFYAVRARKVTGFALPSVDGFLQSTKEEGNSKINRIATSLLQVRLNEPAIQKKSNYLSVAETMFLRGLIFVAMAGGAVLLGSIPRDLPVVDSTHHLPSSCKWLI